MRAPVLVAIVSCALAAVVATTAGGASGRWSDIPACEELLTRNHAADAMDVEEAVIALRDVQGNTRYCSWFGSPERAKRITRSVAVKWGPYTDFRKRVSENGRYITCVVSEAACAALEKSLKAKTNAASFALFAAALDRVGTAKRLSPSAFGGNPAFIWDPGDRWENESRLGPTTWVFVYAVEARSLLSAFCGSVGEPPSHKCALTAARIALRRISSR